jgi:hypothetical protein
MFNQAVQKAKQKGVKFTKYKEQASSDKEDEPPFDETCFDFKLDFKDTLYHSDVLIASATFKSGDMQGCPVPLHCTWYSNAENEAQSFEQIKGASVSAYQPSVEDIGRVISVHAKPASDVREYQGMPMFAECGPLQLCPQVS